MLFNGNGGSLLPLSATLIPTGGAPRAITGRHYGLPVVGFMVHNYRNTGVLSRYGGVIEHKYTRRIE